MNEQRRAEIRAIVDHFRGKPVNQNVLKEFCNLKKYEPIVLSDLDDYTAQVEHDEVVGKLFPKILEQLQYLRYKPEFANERDRKEVEEQNDEIRVSITKLFEEHALPYRFVNNVAEDLGNFVGGKIAMAGTTAFNKSLEVLLHLAQAHFGGEFNMAHAAKYAEEVIRKGIAKRDAALDKPAE